MDLMHPTKRHHHFGAVCAAETHLEDTLHFRLYGLSWLESRPWCEGKACREGLLWLDYLCSEDGKRWAMMLCVASEAKIRGPCLKSICSEIRAQYQETQLFSREVDRLQLCYDSSALGVWAIVQISSRDAIKVVTAAGKPGVLVGWNWGWSNLSTLSLFWTN